MDSTWWYLLIFIWHFRWINLIYWRNTFDILAETKQRFKPILNLEKYNWQFREIQLTLLPRLAPPPSYWPAATMGGMCHRFFKAKTPLNPDPVFEQLLQRAQCLWTCFQTILKFVLALHSWRKGDGITMEYGMCSSIFVDVKACSFVRIFIHWFYMTWTSQDTMIVTMWWNNCVVGSY